MAKDKIKFNAKKTDVFLKKHYAIIILVLIMILGLYFRLYHLNYPAIGYHNQKEIHYLTEARDFAKDGFFEHGFFIPERGSYNHEKHPDGIHGDTFPITQIIGAAMFGMFGYELWAARLPGMLMNLFTILLVYLFLKKLFKREDIALTAAALTAINPLFVFYSHNFQLINACLFFMMLSGYFFLRWKESKKMVDIILTSVFLSIATMSKYPFLVIIVPLLFIFPYKDLIKKPKKYWPGLGIAIVIFLFLVGGWFLHEVNHQPQIEGVGDSYEFKAIDPGKIFSEQFKQSTPYYLADNFTTLGFWFAIIGLVGGLIMFFLKKKKEQDWFFIGCIVASILFVLIMAGKLAGHNYHYFPIAPIVIFFMAYFMLLVANTISGVLKKYRVVIKSLFIIVLILLVLTPSIQAKNRQFDQQFFGLDVAGDYINQAKSPGDEMINSGHQSYGLTWNGDIKSTRGIPTTVEELQVLESERNIQWIFLYEYQTGRISQMRANPELWNYVQQNYKLKQLGFFQNQQQINLVYYILKKGGSFNESGLNDLVQGKQILTKTYETSKQQITFSYMNI
ncbi:glycosyltransferase family 39 protein [archaeon]|nr:glycosyltransferase family 39 protein [archaeon]MBL7056802.1 glycosyltransferase family 39 protein [Candidatus Woesearchaeota archaeon]